MAVVSASGTEMVAPIAGALGARHCVATRMAIADGRYTGEIEFYCYGEGKAVAARRLAAEHGYRLEDSFAYSDSVTDLPLLEAVGHPRAVNPDRALRRVAEQRGWPVFEFAAPTPLSDRARGRLRNLLPAELPLPARRTDRDPGHRSARRPPHPVPALTPRTAAWSLGGVAAAVALSVVWHRRSPTTPFRPTPGFAGGPTSRQRVAAG